MQSYNLVDFAIFRLINSKIIVYFMLKNSN